MVQRSEKTETIRGVNSAINTQLDPNGTVPEVRMSKSQIRAAKPRAMSLIENEEKGPNEIQSRNGNAIITTSRTAKAVKRWTAILEKDSNMDS
jgi:hypothetical protein